MRTRTLTVCAGLLLCSMAIESMACGESLYRIGRGTAYRVYSAPIPANILIYARSQALSTMAGQLVASGHTVRIVENEADMRTQLEGADYEVVIAPFNSLEALGETASRVAALPVVSDDRSERKAAKQRYRRSVAADDSVNRYLHAIHRSLQHSGR